jgi:predicted MFS family arabinose efflux permease
VPHTASPRYRWAVLGAAFLAVFSVIGLGRFGYSAVLPSMQQALGLSGAQAGSLQSWNQVGYTTMALVGGILASRFGIRIIVAVGLFITAVAMFATGLAHGLAIPSFARFLTGAGTGIAFGPSIVLMAAWFEPRRLGIASGIVPTGGSLALVLVGPAVPRLIAGGGESWRLAWYLYGGVGLAIAIIATLVIRDRPREQARGSGPGLSLADLRNIARSGGAWLLGGIYFLYGFAFLLFFTFFQKRLITDLGVSSQTAGDLFLAMGALGVAAGVMWGRLSDSIGRGVTISAVFFVQAAVALVFALLRGVPALATASVLFGLSGMGVPGLFGAACGERFGARLAAASFGFINVFVGLGQMTGPYVGGAMEDAFGSLRPAYLLSAAVFVAGGIAALFLRDKRPGSRVDPAAMQPAHTSDAS